MPPSSDLISTLKPSQWNGASRDSLGVSTGGSDVLARDRGNLIELCPLSNKGIEFISYHLPDPLDWSDGITRSIFESLLNDAAGEGVTIQVIVART